MSAIPQRYNLYDDVWCYAWWDGVVRKAHIVRIEEREGVMQYLVHYTGWNGRLDKWFSFEQAEIAIVGIRHPGDDVPNVSEVEF